MIRYIYDLNLKDPVMTFLLWKNSLPQMTKLNILTNDSIPPPAFVGIGVRFSSHA